MSPDMHKQRNIEKEHFISSVERKIWTDVKNLHDLNQAEKHLPIEHRFTLSQKIAFQLEEQLQLAY